ncbi:MAG: ABC transporter substrate-binding protein [Bacteroidetes bacterium]|nr:ABC transporter substrate-binding protein [Bacteroidota bacterium]
MAEVKWKSNCTLQVLAWLIPAFMLLGLASCKKPAPAPDNIFRYNESAGLSTLDPAFAKDLPHIWACNQLFNTLVEADSQMRIVPGLARRWTISDDGLVYRFVLRNDVYFHPHPAFGGHDRKLTAGDAAYSLRRLADPSTASPGAWILAYVKRSEGTPMISALNDSLLQIELIKPFPPFLGMLSMMYAAVIPHEVVAAEGDAFGRRPVGTGPFLFAFWKDGVKLVLRRNPTYHEHDDRGRQLPYLDGIAIRFLTDRQIAFMEFMKGRFHFMSGVDSRYKDELLTRNGQLREKVAGKLRLIRQPFLNTEYLGFYLGDTAISGPLKQPALRKAINMGINRQKMLRYLRNNTGLPGHGGMIPYGLPGHLPHAGYNYNPQAARQLIQEAGLSGARFTISTTAEYADLLKFIQAELQSLGLNPSIEVQPAATIRELRSKGKLQAFRASWVADYPDAENYMSLFYSPNHTPAGPNYTHFSNAEFDKLYLQALQENDPERRAGLYRQMDSIVMAQAPVVVLFYDEVMRFVQREVQGMQANPSNLLDFRRVRLEKAPD